MYQPRIAVTYESQERLERISAALAMVGAAAVALAPGTASADALASADGLLLSGGPDVNPARYGQTAQAECGAPDDARDALEFAALDEVLRRNLPVLGICRGLQVINVKYGGTLLQHIPQAEAHHHRYRSEQSMAVHPVDVRSGSRLARITGVRRTLVNSRHHQAVNRLGKGLVTSAVAADGTVEALERGDAGYVMAVQWHPEDRVFFSEIDRCIFLDFVNLARVLRR